MVTTSEVQENSEDDMDEMDIPVPSHPERAQANFIKSYVSTDSHSVLDAHPHVVTRYVSKVDCRVLLSDGHLQIPSPCSGYGAPIQSNCLRETSSRVTIEFCKFEFNVYREVGEAQ